MANNYVQFSTEIPYHTAAQKDWLVAALQAASDSDEGPICQYAIEENECTLWLYAEEYGDIERLAALVSEYQLAFQLETSWSTSWASTCSKMRLDEFSGGAVAVIRGEVQFFEPISDALRWLKARE